MVQHSAALARESGDASLAETVASGIFERLDERMAALCRYGVKLTLDPHGMERDDVEELRQAGLDDRAIVDANQVVSYYNYVNRVADGLGVELEDTGRKKRAAPLLSARPWLGRQLGFTDHPTNTDPSTGPGTLRETINRRDPVNDGRPVLEGLPESFPLTPHC